jgi:hypothetical protein
MRITASLAAGAAASILGYMYLGSRYIVLGLRHRKFKVPSVRTSSAFTIRLSYLQSPLTAVPPPGSSMQSCNPCVLPVSLISISRFLQRLFSCCINLMLFAGPECYAALDHISSADGAGRPQSPVLCSNTQKRLVRTVRRFQTSSSSEREGHFGAISYFSRGASYNTLAHLLGCLNPTESPLSKMIYQWLPGLHNATTPQ